MERADSLAQLLAAIRARVVGRDRVIVALAGAPGSGKSTLSDQLVDALNQTADTAAVLPMDGFHYDDLYLLPAGLRPRKGAPMTFDVGGLYHTLSRLRAGEDQVAVPVFDRRIEIARAGARLIPAHVPVIVVEGNWLLLNQLPWTRLHPLYDLTAMVEVPEPVLRQRLAARWQGFDLPEAEITQRLEANDLPNGRLVRDGSIPADYHIING
ncbi:MAG: hypothetical protein B7Z31_07990 [Rhodobacterales bacterium 12-65-15]|nr:MAG: hypothetical protein B7Z31_07990 [Rhodobacterales bacterium 12-65-15]